MECVNKQNLPLCVQLTVPTSCAEMIFVNLQRIFTAVLMIVRFLLVEMDGANSMRIHSLVFLIAQTALVEMIFVKMKNILHFVMTALLNLAEIWFVS